MDYIGDFTTASVARLFFTTHSAAGSPIAPSSAFEAADIRLYKNNSTSERSSQAGWTMYSPFDSITGLHCIQFDLSDDTDAGFYSNNSAYTAVLAPDETVDGVAVVKVIGCFTIGKAVTLDASGVRSAVGLASANLDTQLSAKANESGGNIAAIKAKTDNLPASPAAVGSAMTLSDGAITAAKLASNAITEAKIADGAITKVKAPNLATLEIVGRVITNVHDIDSVTDATHFTLVDWSTDALRAGDWLIWDVTNNGVQYPSEESRVVSFDSETGNVVLESPGLSHLNLYNHAQTTSFALTRSSISPASSGSGLDAAGVRSAIGLASANLDAQLDALPTASENATAVAAQASISTALTTIGTNLDMKVSDVSGGSGSDKSVIVFGTVSDIQLPLIALTESPGSWGGLGLDSDVAGLSIVFCDEQDTQIVAPRRILANNENWITIDEAVPWLAVGCEFQIYPVGAAGVASDIATEAVNTSRVFTLVRTDAGLVSETKTISKGSPANTYAIDFRNDAAANQRIFSVDSIVIVSGSGSGLVFASPERDGRTQVKVRITGVTAGDYTARVTVTYDSGATERGIISVRVVD